MDFTIKTYKKFLTALPQQGYFFKTFEGYLQTSNEKVIILRHDVDKLPNNSLRFAKIQYELGIKGSYYFRIVPQSFDEKIIRQIAEMGHEIGYHYENLSEISKKKSVRSKNEEEFQEVLYKAAIDDFRLNLEKFRKLYPVKTICMHGSPLSKYDNRKLWSRYDYRDFGIVGEPYFDIDFSEVLYLTDTGRRWDGDDVNVRDKVDSEGKMQSAKCKIKTTKDIIKAAEEGLLPDKIMLTIHPQRWTDNPVLWTKELLWQNVKNVVKRRVVRRGIQL